MKSAIIVTAIFAATLAIVEPPKQEIEAADNTPSAAKFFSPCPLFVPTSEQPGEFVSFNKGNAIEQHGSSLTPREAYLLYCTGGGGE